MLNSRKGLPVQNSDRTQQRFRVRSPQEDLRDTSVSPRRTSAVPPIVSNAPHGDNPITPTMTYAAAYAVPPTRRTGPALRSVGSPFSSNFAGLFTRPGKTADSPAVAMVRILLCEMYCGFVRISGNRRDYPLIAFSPWLSRVIRAGDRSSGPPRTRTAVPDPPKCQVAGLADFQL